MGFNVLSLGDRQLWPLAVTLVVLGLLALACRDLTTEADIDATVEARLAIERDFTPEAQDAPLLDPSPTPSPKVLSTQEVVKQALASIVLIATELGNGTGFIYETQGSMAYVVTNAHVLGNANRVDIELGEETYVGQILGIDETMDIAVISICCGVFQELQFSKQGVELGQEVVAIGYAFGLRGEPTITRGIVSARRGDARRGVDVIQTDAPINRGNSGGPMLSMDGLVVGMNTWKITAATSEGLGFAVVANAVYFRAAALVKTDTVHYDGRLFTRMAGPADVEVIDSETIHTFAKASNFIAEVRMGDDPHGVAFGILAQDGREPQSQAVVLSRTLECWNATSSQADETTELDSTPLRPQGALTLGDHVKLVVIEGTAEILVEGKPVCRMPWVFGRAGFIVAYGAPTQKFEALSVWAETPQVSTESSAHTSTPSPTSKPSPSPADRPKSTDSLETDSTTGRAACERFADFLLDVSEREVSDAEFIERMMLVAETAKDSEPPIREASAALLAAVTSGDVEALSDHAADLVQACGVAGYWTR